jgi:hypothetical protein
MGFAKAPLGVVFSSAAGVQLWGNDADQFGYPPSAATPCFEGERQVLRRFDR